MPRYLIVNADEYGLTEGVNAAILSCVRAGVITSTTVITNGRAFLHGLQHLQLLLDRRISIGLHFNLTLGQPLVKENAVFHPRKWLLFRSLIGKIDQEEIEEELSAQWHRLVRSGIQPSHIDGHEHIHILPGVFEVVLKFAAWNRIPIRLPSEHIFGNRFFWPAVWPTLIKKKIIHLFTKRAQTMMAPHHVWSPNKFFSIFGDISRTAHDASTYQSIFSKLPDGVSELMCHPSLPDPELSRYSDISEIAYPEYEFLLSRHFTDLCRQYDVELVSYRQGMKISRARGGGV